MPAVAVNAIERTMSSAARFDGHRLANLGRLFGNAAQAAAPAVESALASTPASAAVQGILSLLFSQQQAKPPSVAPPQGESALPQSPLQQASVAARPQAQSQSMTAIEALLAQIAGIALNGLLKPTTPPANTP